MKNLEERLRIARELLGITQIDMAARLGMSLRGYQDNEQGKRTAKTKVVAEFQALGIDANWLLTGEGPVRLGGQPQPQVLTQSDFEQEFALVSRKNVEVSAGHGSSVDDEEHRDHLAFRKIWLKQQGFKAEELVAVAVKGDSMAPTLAEGDTVLVNTRDASLADGIYVIRIDGGVYVKRLQHRIGGAIGVISDNKDYPDQELSGQQLNDLTIIGRVVWTGGMM